MLEARGGAGFGEQAGPAGSSLSGRKRLDRDLTVELIVLCEIDPALRAVTQLAQDAIAAQRGGV